MNSASSRLDQYHDGLLGREERARFEAELAASPELQAELALQRELDRRLRSAFGPAQKVTGPIARRPRRWLGLAAAAGIFGLAFASWRAFLPSSTPPPVGSESWCAWVEAARTKSLGGDLVGCTVVAPVLTNSNAPVGPVALGEGLYLPMGWRSEPLDIAPAEDTRVYRVTSREGREALVLVRVAREPAFDLANEPRLACARRVVGELEVVELVLDGPAFVLGAISGG